MDKDKYKVKELWQVRFGVIFEKKLGFVGGIGYGMKFYQGLDKGNNDNFVDEL